MLSTESAFPLPTRTFSGGQGTMVPSSAGTTETSKFLSLTQTEREQLLYLPSYPSSSFSTDGSSMGTTIHSTIPPPSSSQSFARLYSSMNTSSSNPILPPVTLKSLTVCVRKRPLNNDEYKTKQFDILTMVPDQESKLRMQQYYNHVSSTPSVSHINPFITSVSDTTVLHEPRTKYDLSQLIINHSFTFDRCFNEHQETNQVYDSLLTPIMKKLNDNLSHIAQTMEAVYAHPHLHIPSAASSTFTTALHGYGTQATIFAYGQTGSGKTHTMMGITNRIIDDLYTLLSNPVYRNLNLVLCLSSFELYCSRIYDLLCDRQPLVLREDGQGNMQVVGLTEYSTRDINVVHELLQKSNNCRSIGMTKVNADSSRSHSVLQLFIRDGHYGKLMAKISLVDLAGSEKAHESAPPDAQTALEAAEINKSLLALKECIRALGRGQYYQRQNEKLQQQKAKQRVTTHVRHSMDSKAFQRLTNTTSMIYGGTTGSHRRNSLPQGTTIPMKNMHDDSLLQDPREDYTYEEQEDADLDEETSLPSNDENGSIIDVDARIQAARFSNYNLPSQGTGVRGKKSTSLAPSLRWKASTKASNKIPHTHIPFRGSKLTQILRDCFTSPGAITIMIATLSPGNMAADHTLNTLRYADRLKEISKHSTSNHNNNTININHHHQSSQSHESVSSSTNQHTNILKTTILADNPAGKWVGVLGKTTNHHYPEGRPSTASLKDKSVQSIPVLPPTVPSTVKPNINTNKTHSTSSHPQFTAQSVVTLDKERRKKNASLVSASATELVGGQESRKSVIHSTKNMKETNTLSSSSTSASRSRSMNKIPPPPPLPPPSSSFSVNTDAKKLTLSALQSSTVAGSRPTNRHEPVPVRSPSRPPPPVPALNNLNNNGPSPSVSPSSKPNTTVSSGTTVSGTNDNQSQLVALLDAQIRELTSLRNRMSVNNDFSIGARTSLNVSPNTQEKKVQAAVSTAIQIQQQHQEQLSQPQRSQPINAKRSSAFTSTRTKATSDTLTNTPAVNDNGSGIPNPVWSTLSSASVSTPQWTIISPPKAEPGKKKTNNTSSGNDIAVRVEDSKNALKDFHAAMHTAEYISNASKDAVEHPIVHVTKQQQEQRKQQEITEQIQRSNARKNENDTSPVGAGPGSRGIYSMPTTKEQPQSAKKLTPPKKVNGGTTASSRKINPSTLTGTTKSERKQSETVTVPLVHLSTSTATAAAVASARTKTTTEPIPRPSTSNGTSTAFRSSMVANYQASPYSQPVVQLYNKVRRSSSVSSGGNSSNNSFTKQSNKSSVVPNWMNTLQSIPRNPSKTSSVPSPSSQSNRKEKTTNYVGEVFDDHKDLPTSPPRPPLLSTSNTVNRSSNNNNSRGSNISPTKPPVELNRRYAGTIGFEREHRDRYFLGTTTMEDDISNRVDITTLSPKSAAYVGANQQSSSTLRHHEPIIGSNMNMNHTKKSSSPSILQESKLSILNYQPTVSKNINPNVVLPVPILTTKVLSQKDIVRASLLPVTTPKGTTTNDTLFTPFTSTLLASSSAFTKGATVTVTALNNSSVITNSRTTKVVRPGGIGTM